LLIGASGEKALVGAINGGQNLKKFGRRDHHHRVAHRELIIGTVYGKKMNILTSLNGEFRKGEKV